MGLLNAVVPADRTAGQGRGVRPPHHRQRTVGRAQDQGERAAGPGRGHERGLPHRVGDLQRGVLERRRQGGPGRLRREAPAPLDRAGEPASSAPTDRAENDPDVEQVSLAEAVEHVTSVRATPCRSCAATAGGRRRRREMARQFWGTDAGFTLIMVSLSSLGALFFRGGMVRKVVTTYSGDTFPTYTPNPIFQKAYASGAVEVEHWSILTFTQRLEAAARGLPAVVTGSLAGLVDGRQRRLRHGRHALRAGGAAGAARPRRHPGPRGRGRRRGQRGAVRAPARRGVGGVGGPARRDRHGGAGGGRPRRARPPDRRSPPIGCWPWWRRRSAPIPAGSTPPGSRVDSYGEDIAFWTEARAATRGDFDAWARQLGARAGHPRGLSRPGGTRPSGLAVGPHRPRRRGGPTPRPTRWTPTAAEPVGARRRLRGPRGAGRGRSARRRRRRAGRGRGGQPGRLGGRGAGRRGRAALSSSRPSSGCGATPPRRPIPTSSTTASSPGRRMLADASTVLGMVVGGPGTRTVACLGAAQVDRDGNLNSTPIPGGPFLVGSGGANDVASRATACVVVSLARPERLVERVGYITSPGARVTQHRHRPRGVAPPRRRRCASPRCRAGPGRWPSACRRSWPDVCGWDVDAARQVEELEPVDDRRGAGPASLRPRAALPVLTAPAGDPARATVGAGLGGPGGVVPASHPVPEAAGAESSPRLQ